MRVPRGILAAAAVIGCHGPVLAQQAPGLDDLASGLGVPSWWTVGTVEIQADSKKDGYNPGGNASGSF